MKQVLRQIRGVGALTLLAAGLLSGACEGFSDPATGTAKTITVVPVGATPNLVVGEAVVFQARAVDASGSILTGKFFEWGSTNESVARVSDYGVVTAVRAGSTTIVASTDDRMGTIRITVSNPTTAK